VRIRGEAQLWREIPVKPRPRSPNFSSERVLCTLPNARAFLGQQFAPHRHSSPQRPSLRATGAPSAVASAKGHRGEPPQPRARARRRGCRWSPAFGAWWWAWALDKMWGGRSSGDEREWWAWGAWREGQCLLPGERGARSQGPCGGQCAGRGGVAPRPLMAARRRGLHGWGGSRRRGAEPCMSCGRLHYCLKK
jgi:hypothetical protein